MPDAETISTAASLDVDIPEPPDFVIPADGAATPTIDCDMGGDDILIGSTGDDNIFGGAGNDVIDGNFGDDDIFGGAGNDILDGGPGADDVFGGEGPHIKQPEPLSALSFLSVPKTPNSRLYSGLRRTTRERGIR